MQKNYINTKTDGQKIISEIGNCDYNILTTKIVAHSQRITTTRFYYCKFA